MDVTAWSKGLSVEVGGHGVVSHVGSGLLRLAADRVGLTGALSTALARPGFWPVHDRGRVLSDLAVMIADGGTTISQIDTLRHQGELFGSVVWGHHGVAGVGGDHLRSAGKDRGGPGAGTRARGEADPGPVGRYPARSGRWAGSG